MTHERSDRVRLNPSEPRCSAASGECTRRSKRARVQAYLPKGAGLENFALTGGGGPLCPWFIALADVHADTPPPRGVKPAVKGLS